MAETHQFEVRCECGARWWLEADDEPYAVECLACGAHAVDVRDLGVLRHWSGSSG